MESYEGEIVLDVKLYYILLLFNISEYYFNTSVFINNKLFNITIYFFVLFNNKLINKINLLIRM